MNYLLDTNILLLYLRENNKLASKIDLQFSPLNSPNVSVLSVVNIGEIRSIAIQRKWGKQRVGNLLDFIGKFPIADIHVENIIQQYAEIDAYSQGLLPEKVLGTSARNMGKNDLWIAATASALGLTLLTTDRDFDHLDGVFLDLAYVDLTTSIR